MVTVTQIEDAIITILNGGSLDITNGWQRGQPPKGRYPSFDYGFVEFASGDKIPTLANQAVLLDIFEITAVFRAQNEDDAETKGTDLLQQIEDLIKVNQTLNGTVEAGWISRRFKDKTFDREDYSIVAIRLILKTRRKEV